MDNIKTIKRSNDIAAAINKAKQFYKENGFMDLTRFVGYFKKIKFESNEQRIHALINWYCLFFGGLNG